MSSFQRLLLRKAIERSLKKAAPSSFAYSKSNNFYVAVLESEKPNEGMLIDSIANGVVSGRVWNGDRYETEGEIGIYDLDDPKLKVTRFYGYTQSTYDGVRDFWVSEILGIPFWYWLSSRISQKLFEVTTRFRHDRIEVLRALVDSHLKELSEETGILGTLDDKSILQLFEETYGQRVFAHPSYKAEGARFRLIIESLAESGELKRIDKHNFKLSATALSTISKYEEAERRHADNVAHNRRLVWLTIVLAAAAVAQVLLLAKST